MSLVTLQHLSSFGSGKYMETIYDKTVFSGARVKTDEFESLCKSVLNGETVSHILLERILFTLNENEGFEQVTQKLLNVFNSVTNDFSAWIQTKINSNSFSVVDFIERYQRLYDATQNLKKPLSYYDNNVMTRSRSYLSLIRNIAIYNNVVNRQYRLGNSLMYLYELLGQYLSVETDVDHIINIFKVFQFYNRFSSFCSNKDYVNDELKTKFTINGSQDNKKIVSMLMNTIDSLIKKLSGETLQDNAIETSKKIESLIQLTYSIGDHDIFYLVYKNLLVERLNSVTSNPQIEMNILETCFDYNNNRELYTQMYSLVYDSTKSRKYSSLYHSMKIEIETKEYDDSFFEQTDRKCVNFTNYRSFAFDNKTSEIENYTPPKSIEIHVNMNRKLFANRYPHFTQTIQHSQSSGVVALRLKDDKVYNVQMALPQLYIIMLLNEREKVTPKEMSESLNIPLKQLGRILNSLIDFSLVSREKGAANNTSLPFSINYDCEFPDTEVSIVTAYKRMMTAQSASQVRPVDINPQVLNARILSILQTPSDYDKIKTEVTRLMEREVPDSMMKNELESLIKVGYVTFSDGMYCYKPTEIDIDVSDEEDTVPSGRASSLEIHDDNIMHSASAPVKQNVLVEKLKLIVDQGNNDSSSDEDTDESVDDSKHTVQLSATCAN